jgi:hypothetical protein
VDRGPRLVAARDPVRHPGSPALAARCTPMHEVPHSHPLDRSALAGLGNAAARTLAFTRHVPLLPYARWPYARRPRRNHACMSHHWVVRSRAPTFTTSRLAGLVSHIFFVE